MAERWIWAPTVDDQMPLPQYIRLVNERMRKLQSTLNSLTSTAALVNALTTESGTELATEGGEVLTIES